ncbi:MAG: MlaD family protein [bacterium]
MRERVRNVLVGACTIGGLGSAALLLFLFGEIEPFMTPRWSIQVAMNEAGGLRKGSLVTVNGVPVGAVDSVKFWGDRDQPVLITALIEKEVRIPDPSVPTVQASLLGSGARLEFTAQLPLADPPRNYPTDSTEPLRGRVQSIESKLIEQIETRIKPVVDAFADVGLLARNINELVAPPKPGEEPSPDSLRAALRRLNDTLASADRAMASAQAWLDDEQLRTDIRDTANGASELMRDASMTANRITALADSLAADAAELKANALPVLERAESALDQLNQVLVAARTGDGTVGKLMKDPQLYDGLADAAKRLDEALAKVNLLLDKIRAEGLNVELFPK